MSKCLIITTYIGIAIIITGFFYAFAYVVNLIVG